jgi:hypothetical protein
LGGEVERKVKRGIALCPIDDYPEHLRLIGSVITRFSLLESSMSIAMWALVGSSEAGTAVFYSIAGARQRIEALLALARSVLPADKVQEEVIATLDVIGKLADRRNVVAHGQWGSAGDGGPRDDPLVQDFKMRRSSDPYPRWHFRVADLQELADAILAARARLNLITRVMDARRNPTYREFALSNAPLFPDFASAWRRFAT